MGWRGVYLSSIITCYILLDSNPGCYPYCLHERLFYFFAFFENVPKEIKSFSGSLSSEPTWSWNVHFQHNFTKNSLRDRCIISSVLTSLIRIQWQSNATRLVSTTCRSKKTTLKLEGIYLVNINELKSFYKSEKSPNRLMLYKYLRIANAHLWAKKNTWKLLRRHCLFHFWL